MFKNIFIFLKKKKTKQIALWIKGVVALLFFQKISCKISRIQQKQSNCSIPCHINRHIFPSHYSKTVFRIQQYPKILSHILML